MKNVSFKVNIFLFMVLVFGAAFVINKFTPKSELKAVIESKDQIINEQNSEIQKIKLDNEKVVFEKNRVEADLKSLEKGYRFLKDSLKAMGVKTKNLETALFLASRTQSEGSGFLFQLEGDGIDQDCDTLSTWKMDIDERFFEFFATINPNHEYFYNYTMWDSLSIVNTSSRKNIFSPKEYKVRIHNANPNTEIRGVTSLTIKEKHYNWVIGPVVGGGFTGNGGTWFVGVGIMRPIIRF